jgi:hypothetical protein
VFLEKNSLLEFSSVSLESYNISKTTGALGVNLDSIAKRVNPINMKISVSN